MPDEGGNQRGYQWPSVEVPPSSVVISGSASLISGHQWKCLGRVRARSAVAEVRVRQGVWVSSGGLGFVRGFGFVRGGVRERVWVRDWNSRADAKVEAGGSDDKLRDVALRHVRGHLMRGAISGHQRSSEVIRGL